MSTRIPSYQRAGLTFDVRDEGPLGGDPVVLLHGFPERSSSWHAVAPRLHDAGLRTLAPDQRGYSPGARPRRRSDYRLRELVADVVALIDEAGRPVHLVGHDWGAVVSWLLAGDRPDLVRTLTAVSVPHPAAFARSFLRSEQALRSWYMAAFQLPVLPELAARARFLDDQMRRAGMTEEEVRRFREEVVEDGALPFALNWYRAIPLPPRAAAHRVRVPTTMVWSDRDSAVSRAGVELCEQFVTSPYELVVFDGVTHWVPTQAPEPLAAAILRRVGPADG